MKNIHDFVYPNQSNLLNVLLKIKLHLLVSNNLFLTRTSNRMKIPLKTALADRTQKSIQLHKSRLI